MINLKIGQRFGKLTVISEGEKFFQPSGQHQRGIICKCDCGNIKKIRLSHLRHSRVTSCGCILPPRIKFYHKRLYNSWRGMRNRCYGAKYPESQYYGKKGITICDEWKNSYNEFAIWALANGWNENLTIDRIDGLKGYYPENCRFVTQFENNINKPGIIIVEYYGKKIPFIVLLKGKGLYSHYGVIIRRIRKYGYSVEDAFDIPIKKRYAKSRKHSA